MLILFESDISGGLRIKKRSFTFCKTGMDAINKLQEENKLLQERIVELQEDLDRHHHAFRQIEDFSSRLGVSIELTEI